MEGEDGTESAKRLTAIGTILFPDGPDFVFVDEYRYNYGSLMEEDLYKRFGEQMAVFSVALDDAEISDSEGELIGKTRHIFRFDGLCDFEEELLKQLKPHYSRVHFVSKRLNCILSVYDQRGCAIVFFDKRHFKKAYFLLHEYLFDYDMKLMESRLKS